jgi:hypothetical protein
VSKHCCRRYARRTRAKLTQLRRDSQFSGQGAKALSLKIQDVASELEASRSLNRMSLQQADGAAARSARLAMDASSRHELVVQLVTHSTLWSRVKYVFTSILRGVND